jgi:hypothetical protein
VGSLQMQGFAGDTLHMSRLHDASRKTRGGYGLEALSSDKQVRGGGGGGVGGPKRGPGAGVVKGSPMP